MSIFSFKTLSRVASAAILIGATAELAHAETTLSLNQAVDGFNNDKIIEELSAPSERSPILFDNISDDNLDNSPNNGNPSARIPVGALKLSDSYDYLFWAETKNGLLHLLERDPQGGYNALKSIKMSIGKLGYGKRREGDKRTPIGVYRLTSFLNEEQLTDFYGDGAYPLDYPNANDKLQQRTGHGIWLHGLPKGVESRPAWDSDGCVVIDNTSLNELAEYIKTGDTYVVIDEELQWQSVDSAATEAAQIEYNFYRWLDSWQQIDNDTYLDYYASDFSNLEKDKAAWESYKRRIHRNKRFIDVKISDLSVFDYPGEENLISVRYYQAYKSNNYRWNGWKEQLWKNIDGQWKIVYEGDA